MQYSIANQKDISYSELANSAATLERKGLFNDAAKHWRAANNVAINAANKQWAEFRAESCEKKVTPQTKLEP